MTRDGGRQVANVPIGKRIADPNGGRRSGAVIDSVGVEKICDDDVVSDLVAGVGISECVGQQATGVHGGCIGAFAEAQDWDAGDRRLDRILQPVTFCIIQLGCQVYDRAVREWRGDDRADDDLTLSPLAINVSTKWLPMKPVPPVTKIVTVIKPPRVLRGRSTSEYNGSETNFTKIMFFNQVQ